ncbi:MAG: hypothetical protein H6728_03275 [Myxococcales bacterium]|nr:hypothetical protein [Myxococcales bacterium]MCB9642072.1 hypothetical protein [Myxococcales bacterium]
MSIQRSREILCEDGDFLQQLRQVSQEALLSASLLHRLACDCAERALEQSLFPLAQLIPESYAAITLRKLWLQQQEQPATPDEEKIDPKMLLQAVDAARAAAYRLSTTQQGVEAAQAAADAADDAAYALRALAWAQASAAAQPSVEDPSQARAAEALWQKHHLLSMLGASEGQQEEVS